LIHGAPYALREWAGEDSHLPGFLSRPILLLLEKRHGVTLTVEVRAAPLAL
jgi:hypothetical protein